MSKKLERISDIYFGKVDAKKEILGVPPEKRDYLKHSFVKPPSVSIDKILSGEAFFITGMKGSGKTALIREIGSKFEASKAVSDIVLFRRAMAEGAAASSVFRDVAIAEQNDGDDFIDFEAPLFWFVHRQLALLIMDRLPEYKKWRGVGDYLAAVSAFAPDPKDKSFFRKLFPQVTDGNIKVSAKAIESVSAEIGVNFEYGKDDTAPLISVVASLNGMIDRLTDLGKPVRLLFDEIELSLSSQKQFRRDAQLIRDFVIVIGRLNELFLEAGVDIRIIAAIRSEVILSSFATGKEMYKLLEDCSVEVDWYRGEGIDDEPLLRVVASKINATEILRKNPITADVWSAYFDGRVFNKPVKQFVMDMTWCRPRDIVRLFECAQEAEKNNSRFTHSAFKRGAKAYSEKCWSDICEELQASYNQHEIRAVKDIFFAFRRRITMAAFEAEAECKSHLDWVRALLKKKKPRVILDDMYRIGVVGNASVKGADGKILYPERWAFRGFKELDGSKDLIVHPALWEEFELVE